MWWRKPVFFSIFREDGEKVLTIVEKEVDGGHPRVRSAQVFLDCMARPGTDMATIFFVSSKPGSTCQKTPAIVPSSKEILLASCCCSLFCGVIDGFPHFSFLQTVRMGMSNWFDYLQRRMQN